MCGPDRRLTALHETMFGSTSTCSSRAFQRYHPRVRQPPSWHPAFESGVQNQARAGDSRRCTRRCLALPVRAHRERLNGTILEFAGLRLGIRLSSRAFTTRCARPFSPPPFALTAAQPSPPAPSYVCRVQPKHPCIACRTHPARAVPVPRPEHARTHPPPCCPHVAGAHSRFTRGRDAQHYGSDGHLRARGGRRRKLFGRALRVCLPRLRHLTASATIRGLKSTTDRLAATGSRRSRGHAQPAAQRLPIVEVKADMGFVVDVQTRSGSCLSRP